MLAGWQLNAMRADQSNLLHYLTLFISHFNFLRNYNDVSIFFVQHSFFIIFFRDMLQNSAQGSTPLSVGSVGSMLLGIIAVITASCENAPLPFFRFLYLDNHALLQVLIMLVSTVGPCKIHLLFFTFK